MKKVVFITEYLNEPYDEGIKKTVYILYNILNDRFDLLGICRIGSAKLSNVKAVKTNRLFINFNIKNYIKRFRPIAIVYLPFPSSTFASFLRHFILAKYYPSAKNIMFALQPKPLKKWQKKFIRLIHPDIILTPSPLLKESLNALNFNTKLLPLYTDLTIFKPINNSDNKTELRKKYKIPIDAYVISHMGHLNDGRNLKSLIPLQQNASQVVIVGSSSTPKDSIGPDSLKEELINAGIIILDFYIENIQEVYQLSDLYIFPVVAPNSSIGMPLSILEARACGIPVLTTDFGSIKKYLSNDHGSIFYSSPDKFLEMVSKIRISSVHEFSITNVNTLNDEFIKTIIESV